MRLRKDVRLALTRMVPPMTARFVILTALIALAAPAAAPAQFSESYNFLKAVRDADGTKVTTALNKPGTVIINTRDPSTGESALHIVTARRDSVWLGFLLQRGANPDVKDGNGATPLMTATQLGWVDGIATLLARRAGVDVAGPSGETPLIRAVQNRDMASVRALLAAGANPNRPDNAAGLSARQYAERDSRALAILKELKEAKPTIRREVAGPL